MSPDRMYLLYDGRACVSKGASPEALCTASLLSACYSDEDARKHAGDFGDMACWSFPVEKQNDGPDKLPIDDAQHEWDWTPERGFH